MRTSRPLTLKGRMRLFLSRYQDRLGSIGDQQQNSRRGRFTLNSGSDCSDTATLRVNCGHSLVEDCAVPQCEQLEIC